MTPTGIIKSLSLMQPYAWMIANGHLLVDDRSWGTKYRGPLLIHASKKFHAGYYDFIRTKTNILIPEPHALEYGGVVGIGNLIACCKPGDAPENITALQRDHFGGVHSEYYGFLIEGAQPLPLIPCRGKLMIFDIDMDSIKQIPAAPQMEFFS